MVTGTPRVKRWRSQAARCILELAGNPDSMPVAVQAVIAPLLDGVPCPPTDLNVVQQKVGISHCTEGDIAGSGELRRNGSTYTIVYSQFLPKVSQRSIIAHEIGHAFLEVTRKNLPRAGKEVERLCDMIAAEILMPRAVISELARGKTSIRTIAKIARTFDVSFRSAAIRCAELKGLTVFEVEKDRVTWAWGMVKNGPVHRLDESIKDVVTAAYDGKRVDEHLFFDGVAGMRPWRIEYVRRYQGQLFFLLQPVRGLQGPPCLNSPPTVSA